MRSLDEWKKLLIALLEGQEATAKSLGSILYPPGLINKKALGLLEKARGFPVGTIREWQGKKYKKMTSGKWTLAYEGKDSRGERQAIRNVRRKIAKAETMEDLVEIVSENYQRFQDSDGHILPVVKEFMAEAREHKAGKEKGKPKKEEKPKEKEQPKKKEKPLPPGIKKIKEKYESGPSSYGRAASIYVAGKKVRGKWKMVEVEAPSASHNEKTFHKTPGFPQSPDGSTINDRDYEQDKDAQLAVNAIGSNLTGEALGMDSPIVVSKDGIVVSGNNRTMSSKIAARKGTDGQYLEDLQEKAEFFGFNPNDMEEFENPRVVFELDEIGEYTTEEFAKYNKDSKKAKNTLESAVTVAKTIKESTIKEIGKIIEEYDTLSELYQDKKATHRVFRILQSGGIIDEFSLPQYITDKTGVSEAGKEFLETVLVGSVLSADNLRALANAKGLRKKLVKVVVPMAENKTFGDYSTIPELNQAVDVITQIQSGAGLDTVDDYVKQGDMFKEKEKKTVIALARHLQLKERAFGKFFREINKELKNAASGQADIFSGGVETKDQILNRMMRTTKSMRYIVRKGLTWKLKPKYFIRIKK